MKIEKLDLQGHTRYAKPITPILSVRAYGVLVLLLFQAVERQPVFFESNRPQEHGIEDVHRDEMRSAFALRVRRPLRLYGLRFFR